MDNSQIGLAGEYYVLAQLAQRGLVGTMTLSNTKGIDILVTNPDLNRLYKLEVKTTRKKASKELLFSDKPLLGWAMNQKHEDVNDLNLYYVFVQILSPSERPRFFIVPSSAVATYVKWQHNYWLESRAYKVKDTPMRKFRILDEDLEKYEDNWKVFEK